MDHPPDDSNRLLLLSLMDYFSEHGIGYGSLPDIAARRLSDHQRTALVCGLMYAWSPEHVRYEIQIPRNAFRHSVKVIKPIPQTARVWRSARQKPMQLACARMFKSLGLVTDYPKDQAPLADPEEVAAFIKSLGDGLHTIFSRS